MGPKSFFHLFILLPSNDLCLGFWNCYWSWYEVHHITAAFSCMMTSSNRNIFRVTGHLLGESTGDRWIPLTKASDAELWCLWSPSEPVVEQAIKTPVIWDAMALITTSPWCVIKIIWWSFLFRKCYDRIRFMAWMMINKIIPSIS